MKITSCRIGFCALTLGLGWVPLGARAQDWWLGGGPVFRGAMRATVDSRPTHAQMSGLLGATVPGPLLPPGGIGPVNGYADRSYDDGGYVKKDPGTGVSTIDPNTTWNWGFQPGASASYDAAGRTLALQKTGNPADTTSANGTRDDMLGVGLQLLAGLPLKQSGDWSWDLVFGFQGTWGAEAKLNQGVSQITVRDQYDVSGVAAASFPAIGFQGTYRGPFDTPPVIPSPVIPNQPAGRAFSTALDSSTFKVDQSLYQFSVGPQLGWAASGHLKLNLRPTISANIVDVDVKRTETFLGTAWSDSGGQMNVFLGFGVTGGADWDLGKGYYAGVFGGYEWVLEKLTVPVGPNTVSVDASGFVAGAVIGKRF